MKKRILSLLLALALWAGLAAPALAVEYISNDDMEPGMLIVQRNIGKKRCEKVVKCPLNTPASGEGWSYDGNYTLTFHGIKDPKLMFDPCLDYGEEFHIVLADGTENPVNCIRIHQPYELRYTDTQQVYGEAWSFGPLTISGEGSIVSEEWAYLYCSQLTMNGGTVRFPEGELCTAGLEMNGGSIQFHHMELGWTPSLMGDVSLNGGEIVLDRREWAAQKQAQAQQAGHEPHPQDISPLHINDAPGVLGGKSDSILAKLDQQFVDENGRPLTARRPDGKPAAGSTPGGTGYLYTAEGAPASYAKFSKSASNPSGSTSSAGSTGGFADVPAGAYYAQAVKWAVEQGITTGTSNTAFSPEQTCTQAQILTFLWRASGSPQAQNAPSYSQYYAQAAQWAGENGIMDSSFVHNAPCTRAMTVEYLWKAAGSPRSEAKTGFADVQNGSDLAQAVAWAVDKGITTGTSDTTFSPDRTCTRGQIVTFLHRAMGE